MFETVELGHSVDKKTYDREVDPIRVDLVNLQYDLKIADPTFPVVVILSGDDRVGYNGAFDALHEWLDTRYLDSYSLGPSTDEESERPEYWRYWRSLPARGKVAVYAGGWTLRAIRDRMGKRIKKADFERALERIERFERALADDGTLVLKFWMHRGKKDHAQRLEKARKDPHKAWRITEVDQRIYESYDRAIMTVERAIRKTSTLSAPWQVIESADWRYRNLEVARRIRAGLQHRLQEDGNDNGRVASPPVPTLPPAFGEQTVLDSVDLTAKIEKPRYDRRLTKYQAKLHDLASRAVDKGVTSVLVFEGWDAAGKGGCIRRMTSAMNPRFYRVIPIAKPTPEEYAHHYMWRFWNNIPPAGHVAIFDRSWYGRVLVERVEGFATEAEWIRAYGEINEFEEQLTEHGILLQKYWLHIDEDEQMRRFKAREKTSYKKHKMTDEDYRNRERWAAYELAVNDMVARTSTEFAPWHVLPANDKRFARIQVIRSFCKGLAERLRQEKKRVGSGS